MKIGETSAFGPERCVEITDGSYIALVTRGGEPTTLIKNYDLLPTREKVSALKSVMLHVVHEAEDHLEILDPTKLAVEHVGISLPRNSRLVTSGQTLLENPRKYESILLSAEDEHRILTYSNRGYEIAGTMKGRILMRKLL